MKNLKVLVADDSMFMRSIIKRALAKAMITEIVEAGNGEEAVEIYKAEKPAFCLVDITMPKKSGLDVLKEIKAMDPETVVVMCSAIGQETVVMEAIKNGAADFIVKPFQEDKIIEVVQTYLAEI